MRAEVLKLSQISEYFFIVCKAKDFEVDSETLQFFDDDDKVNVIEPFSYVIRQMSMNYLRRFYEPRKGSCSSINLTFIKHDACHHNFKLIPFVLQVGHHQQSNRLLVYDTETKALLDPISIYQTSKNNITFFEDNKGFNSVKLCRTSNFSIDGTYRLCIFTTLKEKLGTITCYEYLVRK